MSTTLDEEIVRKLIATANVPLVFPCFVKNWSTCQWNVEQWSSVFGNREIPFRCMKKRLLSDEPCWERKCDTKTMTFKQFLDKLPTSEEWMYFDYKYLHQWFGADTALCKELSWKQFGFPDKGAADSTLWAGSAGAHTPAHRDTYGVNVVAQLCGKKRWILFPPEAGGLKPTRVPYEESSVYSELNFYCPKNLDLFKGLAGARAVDLRAGDALLVPRGWWHYVQNMDALNIALNVWLPHEKDSSAQVSEALVKILVAQVCKDLPRQTARLVVNPNEDDLADTPLTVLLQQLEAVADACLASRRRARRKRTWEGDPADAAADASTADGFDLQSLLEDRAGSLERVPSITSDDLIRLLRENIRQHAGAGAEAEAEGGAASLRLPRAVLDAFSQGEVVELVKRNLLARLSERCPR